MLDQKEPIIIDIGMIHTKLGSNNSEIPFKIIDTPAHIFLNPKFLE